MERILIEADMGRAGSCRRPFAVRGHRGVELADPSGPMVAFVRLTLRSISVSNYDRASASDWMIWTWVRIGLSEFMVLVLHVYRRGSGLRTLPSARNL